MNRLNRNLLLAIMMLAGGVLACNVPGLDTPAPPTPGGVTPVTVPPVTVTATGEVPPTLETVPPADTPTPGTPETSGIHPLMMRNATYVIEGSSYTLEGGSFEDPSIQVTVFSSDITALGDLNGDGVIDAATIVSQNTGGSGTFIYLAAMINSGVAASEPFDPASLTNLATIFLGDRVIVHNIEIADGLIGVDFTTQDADDPFCCPTLDAHQTFQLQDNALVVVDESVAEGGIAAYMLYDMTYTLEVNDYPLEGGVYQDTATGVTVTLRGPRDLNDLNGDGLKDAAVIIVLDGGGTGKFVNLAAVVDQGGVPTHIAAASLGDREIIHNLWIDQFGTIHVEGTFHGADDPGCCPEEYRVLKYTLIDNELVAVP